MIIGGPLHGQRSMTEQLRAAGCRIEPMLAVSDRPYMDPIEYKEYRYTMRELRIPQRRINRLDRGYSKRMIQVLDTFSGDDLNEALKQMQA